MARKYDQLPVYIAVYELLLKSLDMTKRASREYRYTLCEDLNKDLVHVLLLVRKANVKDDAARKLAHVEEALDRLSDCMVRWRVLNDMRCISETIYAQLAFESVEAENELIKWRDYLKKNIDIG